VRLLMKFHEPVQNFRYLVFSRVHCLGISSEYALATITKQKKNYCFLDTGNHSRRSRFRYPNFVIRDVNERITSSRLSGESTGEFLMRVYYENYCVWILVTTPGVLDSVALPFISPFFSVGVAISLKSLSFYWCSSHLYWYFSRHLPRRLLVFYRYNPLLASRRLMARLTVELE
ncbi:24206_t:CDS:2, partial [Racocetra persica]